MWFRSKERIVTCHKYYHTNVLRVKPFDDGFCSSIRFLPHNLCAQKITSETYNLWYANVRGKTRHVFLASQL